MKKKKKKARSLVCNAVNSLVTLSRVFVEDTSFFFAHTVNDVNASTPRARFWLHYPRPAVSEVRSHELSRLARQQERLRYEIEVSDTLAPLHCLDVLVETILASYLVGPE